MMSRAACSILLIFEAVFVVPPICRAEFIVAPNQLASAEGSSNAATDPNTRCQQVYGSSQFSDWSRAAYITQLAFRPDATFGRAFSATNPSLQVNLSTTSRSPGNLSRVFAENLGGDDSMVRSGPITFSSAFSGPPGGPKDFDVIIDLERPFLYDPEAGNLLVDFRTVGPLWGMDVPMDFVTGSGTFGVVSTVAAPLTASSGIPSTQGYVTRFRFTPIPEPRSLVLLLTALNLCGLGYASRRPTSAS